MIFILLVYFSHKEKYETCYNEDLTVKVVCGAETLYSKGIRGSKAYNSTFLYTFDKDVVIPEGAECCVEIHTNPVKEANYQVIPESAVRKLHRAVNCHADRMRDNEPDASSPQTFIFKSVHVLPID